MLYGGMSSLKSTIAAQYEAAQEELRLPGLFEGRPFGLFSKGTGRFIIKSGMSVSGASIEPPKIGRSEKPSLDAHLTNSAFIERESGVPLCKPTPALTFRLIQRLYTQDRDIWELAAILFDENSIEIPDGTMAESVILKIKEEGRRRELGDWLAKSVADSAQVDVDQATDELGAVYSLLTGYKINQAAKRAVQSRNYHLASVLPFLGSADIDVRTDAKHQLADWAENKTTLYIPKDVRRVYELLAGNTTVSGGSGSDRVYMADGLDWQRAFGLELWYGGKRSTPISETVEKYRLSTLNAANKVAPVPQGDRSFALLSLYDSISPNLANALEVGNNSSRVPWLLYCGLVLARGKFKDEGNVVGDNLSQCYGSELEAAGNWLEALFVYLHIHNESVAQQEVQRVLSLHVREISASAELQQKLRALGIADSLVHEADALIARYNQDHLRETHSLLAANLEIDAHEVLVTNVAPEAVIAENFQLLRELLGSFHYTDSIPAWGLGGQVYSDYVSLIESRKAGDGHRADELANRLVASLSNMKSVDRFYPRVAMSIMSSYVASFAIGEVSI
jgi:nuclear pore complex protein Nup98-Nup96